jgi:hypothetical protein
MGDVDAVVAEAERRLAVGAYVPHPTVRALVDAVRKLGREASELDGPTRLGDLSAYPANPGEFAARWNARSADERAAWLGVLMTATAALVPHRPVDGSGPVRQYLESVRENRGLPATPSIEVSVAVANALIAEHSDAVEKAEELGKLVDDDYNDLRHRNRRQSEMIAAAAIRHRAEIATALDTVEQALEAEIHHGEDNGFQIKHHGGPGVHAIAVPATNIRAAVEGAKRRLGLLPPANEEQ